MACPSVMPMAEAGHGEMQRRFEPYAFNGGNILAVAGEDFSIVAADTRLSQGFTIHSRNHPKAIQLTDSTVLAQSGFEGMWVFKPLLCYTVIIDCLQLVFFLW